MNTAPTFQSSQTSVLLEITRGGTPTSPQARTPVVKERCAHKMVQRIVLQREWGGNTLIMEEVMQLLHRVKGTAKKNATRTALMNPSERNWAFQISRSRQWAPHSRS